MNNAFQCGCKKLSFQKIAKENEEIFKNWDYVDENGKTISVLDIPTSNESSIDIINNSFKQSDIYSPSDLIKFKNTQSQRDAQPNLRKNLFYIPVSSI